MIQIHRVKSMINVMFQMPDYKMYVSTKFVIPKYSRIMEENKNL